MSFSCQPLSQGTEEEELVRAFGPHENSFKRQEGKLPLGAFPSTVWPLPPPNWTVTKDLIQVSFSLLCFSWRNQFCLSSSSSSECVECVSQSATWHPPTDSLLWLFIMYTVQEVQMAFCKARGSEKETSALRHWPSDLDTNKALSEQWTVASSWCGWDAGENLEGREKEPALQRDLEKEKGTWECRLFRDM